jgi:hypothetical protein
MVLGAWHQMIVEHVWATFYKKMLSGVDATAQVRLGSVCNVAQSLLADSSFVG